jgi:cold shock CspA family protein
MRSIVGVGMTPPNVLGTPKPASSVMIRSTFGAPFGGTTRGAHQGFDCRASSLMTPPNFGSGGGSCLPVMVVVALGEPSTPLICCAFAAADNKAVSISAVEKAGLSTLNEGAKVSYEEVPNKGKTSAENLRVG